MEIEDKEIYIFFVIVLIVFLTAILVLTPDENIDSKSLKDLPIGSSYIDENEDYD